GTARLAWPADRVVHVLRARAQTPIVSRLAPGRIVIGRRAGGRRATRDQGSRRDSIGDEGQRISLGRFVEASGMVPLVMATSKDPNPKVTLLLFPPGSDAPKLVVKAATTAVAECAVEAEGRMLVE